MGISGKATSHAGLRSLVPVGTQRSVYTFNYYTGPREITKYEYESENNDVA